MSLLVFWREPKSSRWRGSLIEERSTYHFWFSISCSTTLLFLCLFWCVAFSYLWGLFLVISHCCIYNAFIFFGTLYSCVVLFLYVIPNVSFHIALIWLIVESISILAHVLKMWLCPTSLIMMLRKISNDHSLQNSLWLNLLILV
jgi:hypothetical protein